MLIYFVFALLMLILYAAFMVLKFSLKVKVTRFVVFLHFLTAFLAIFSFLVLFISKFKFNYLSPLGFIVIVLGFMMLIFAAFSLKAQTFVPKGELVSSGIYSYIRNPMYLGLILMAFGSIFFSLSSYIFIYTLILIFVYLVVIRFEEMELSKRLGKVYDDYRKRVPSLIPRLKR